jgi:HlyD family secretion protein
MSATPRSVTSAIARRWRASLAASGGLALVAGTVVIDRPSAPWPHALARLSAFESVLLEVGAIGVERLVLYGSTIPGVPAKLIEIVPEGRTVQAGDVLARFDTTAFEQARQRETAALRQAEADVVLAREEARLELLRAEEDLEAARQEIISAERALVNQTDGRGQVDLVAAETAAAEAARELTQARTMVRDLEPLLAEKFITRAEFQRAKQALERAEDQEELAVAKRDALRRFERPAAISRAESDVQAARENFARRGEALSARAASRGAAIDAATSRIAEIRARLAVIGDQIDRSVLRAEAPGLVVHKDLFFGSDKRKPQLGDEVFPNQPILAVPDSSKFTVETRVRETDLHKISPGQRAHAEVDAYPGLRLPAFVASIGALAQEDADRAGTKYFPVTLRVGTEDARLRTGMTARVEIAITSLPSAVVVPVQAVFEDRGERYVVVAPDGAAARRAVVVAAENETLAAIGAGLSAGESVLLVDPTAAQAGR